MRDRLVDRSSPASQIPRYANVERNRMSGSFHDPAYRCSFSSFHDETRISWVGMVRRGSTRRCEELAMTFPLPPGEG
jgi:hypothetical protein